MGLFDFFNKDKKVFKETMEGAKFEKNHYTFINKGPIVEVYFDLNGENVLLFNIENKQYTLDTIANDDKYKNIIEYARDNKINHYDTFMLIANDKDDILKPFLLDIKHLLLERKFSLANKYEKEDFSKFGFKYKDLFGNDNEEKTSIDKGVKSYTLKDGRKIYYKFHKAAEYSSGEWIMLDYVSFNIPESSTNEIKNHNINVVEANLDTRLKTEEGIKAFQNIDTANKKVEELSFDKELQDLFKESLVSANKMGNYIKENIYLESKVFVFYNHVELIKRWIDKILELKKLNIPEKEYKEIKDEAIKAIPALKAKIDEEYNRHTMPIIEDLKAEMEAISKY